MALKNIIAPRQQVQNSQSKAVAGGNVFLYQPGTTTFITSYFDSGLVQPHANPVRLSGSGRANIWITQDCDLRVEDKNGNLILEELNANPDAVGVDQGGGLVPNGSFEIDADADQIPDGWTLVSELGATNAIDTSQSTDGAQSFRFTSSGNGGGSLTSTDFFPVNDTDNLSVAVDMFASIATVLNIVRVQWFDISFVSISNSDIYSSTANPLTWTTQNLLATPPALARFAKLELIGGDPSVAIAGSSWWDNVSVFYPAIVSGVFDNVTIQDNQIITTNVNGDLELGPNGTGAVNINQANPVTLADAKNALNLGTNDPANDPHLAMGLGAAGVTIIQAKATGTTAVDRLDLQPLGGECNLGQQTGTDGVLTQIFQDGAQRLIVDTYGMSLRGELDADPSVPDNVESAVFLESRDGNAYGLMGFDGGTALELVNYADLAVVTLSGMDGVVKDTLFQGTPGGAASVHFDGDIKVLTEATGIRISGSVAAADPPTTEAVDTAIELADLAGDTQLGIISYNNTNDLRIANNMREGEILLTATATAGTPRNLADFDPDGDVTLYHIGAAVVRTLTAAAGGLEANNTLTGAGFERVLTVGDLVGIPTQFNTAKAADEFRFNNTPALDGDLQSTVSGFTHYAIQACCSFSNANATPDVRIAFGASSASGQFNFVGISENATVGQFAGEQLSSVATNFTLVASLIQPTVIQVNGYLDTGDTGGHLCGISWSQNVTDGVNGTRLEEGSWMIITGIS